MPVPGDPGDMLGAVATGGAQLRGSAEAAEKAGVGELTGGPRPRMVVVAGMGGSAAAGDVLAAVAGELASRPGGGAGELASRPGGGAGELASRPLPIVVRRGYTLPAWVGPDDLVLGVSCSGRTEETLAAVAEAARRGVRIVTVGGPDSPLAAASAEAGGLHIPVDDGGRQPRACLWSLAGPLLLVARAVGLADISPGVLDEAADVLDGLDARCGPGAPPAGNPAKQLAEHLHGGLPVVWGGGAVAGAAAYRFSCQLAENAKLPSVCGDLPEPQHNQIVAFDGAFGRGAGAGVGMRLVVLRDTVEHPQVARRSAESGVLAAERGLPATQVRAQGEHPLVRLASLIGLTDYASVHLALALGVDPTPVEVIVTLKERLAR